MNYAPEPHHTPRHSALATAVRIIIEIGERSHIEKPSDAMQQIYERMLQEVEKWNDTDDVYALGIMAPLHALGHA